MSENSSKPGGRGRARGRAAKVENKPETKASTPVATSSKAQPAPPPIGRAASRAKHVESSGDLASQVATLSVSESGDSGNGKPIGRGSVRSGRAMDLASTTLVTKPSTTASKKGTCGQAVKLVSNYFSMKTDQSWSLCKHHVDFNPPEDRTFMRKILLKIHKDKFQGYLFDGSTLFTIKNACPSGQPLELVSTKNDGGVVKITVKFVGTCESGDYQYLQIFNIVMRDCLSYMKLQLIRRNYFDPAAKINIPEHKLELWPGYVTSVSQCENSIFLQAEISYKVLRRDTAYDLFKSCLQEGGDFKTNYSNAIMGAVVLTSYNNKTYRVDEVDFSSMPTSTFPVKKKKKGTDEDGNAVKEEEVTNVSYMDYYEKRYNLRINDNRQPMLVSRSSAKDRRAGQMELVYLVPELCIMTGLTDQMRSNFQLMKAVATHTSVGPADRVRRLMNFNGRLNGIAEVKQKLKSWGIELAPRLVDIPGRILPPETIVVANNRTYAAGPEADWTRQLRSNQMLMNAELKTWILICPQRSEREMRSFVETLQTCARGMNFQVARPVVYPIQDDRASSYVQSLDRALHENNPQLAMCIVSNNRSDRYSAIKKKCIVDKPTPSQVVLYKTMTNKGLMSIATKIAIQLNCKIGGAAWGVPIPLSGLMAVGFDVCHDPSDKRRSYGAMVATLDRTCTRYFSSVSHHGAGEEVSTNFAMNLMKGVSRYQKLNQELPKTIVIFRDGVGEGNLKYVYEQEVQNVKKNLATVYEEAKIPLKLCFIVVTKRINTRIIHGDRNPPPGTIVDDVITSPYRYDFYLVSQSVRVGTVSPTHYNVLEDTTGLQPDHIQRLTYKFTHLYYNWSGTVRVPAPCQYAHKLAFLTAQSVGMAHSNLDQLLYFL